MEYRKISEEEIAVLEKQYCRAEDWSVIEVCNAFKPGNIHQVTFYGPCRLGNFSGKVKNITGKEVGCGLYNATIENAVLEDNVLIKNVRKLANYHVEQDVIIENVGEVSVHDETTFGNGIEIDGGTQSGANLIKEVRLIAFSDGLFDSLV